MKIILPPDPFWLLRLDVAYGDSVPMTCWFWWHVQFMRPVNVG